MRKKVVWCVVCWRWSVKVTLTPNEANSRIITTISPFPTFLSSSSIPRHTGLLLLFAISPILRFFWIPPTSLHNAVHPPRHWQAGCSAPDGPARCSCSRRFLLGQCSPGSSCESNTTIADTMRHVLTSLGCELIPFARHSFPRCAGD